MRWISATLMVTLFLGFGAAMAAAGDSVSPVPGAVSLHPARLFSSADILGKADSGPTGLPPGMQENGRVKRAMLYSLILPGLGEYSLGHKGRAKAFFAAEGAVWAMFGVFRVEGSHRRDLYREFAEIHAGVSERNDDDFYRVIGNFDSSDGPFSANEDVRRRARALFPDDPQAQREYFEGHAYLDGNAWSWESEALRRRYRDLRSSSLDAYHRADLTLGLLVANRILSALDVGLIGARRSRDGDDTGSVSWEFENGRDGPGAHVTLARTF